MADNIPSALTLTLQDKKLEAAFSGDWVLEVELTIPVVENVFAQLREGEEKNAKQLVFSTKELGHWDSLLMIELINLINYAKKNDYVVDLASLPQGIQGLLNLVYAVPEQAEVKEKHNQTSWIVFMGSAGLALFKDTQELIVFIGEIVLSLLALIRHKTSFRLVDFWRNIQESGPSALPIISLISLLVGLILAFVGSLQLALFGAQLYIADMVGLGMTREMGGLMSAVIMTGRSGSAYAAQLGTMQVNNEINALKTMGFEPMSFLVLPRLLALICMMPLLCMYADLMGIIGGALVSVSFFDIALVQYLNRTADAIHLKDLVVGITKCFVYGVLIALSGCLRGMQCGRSASDVGEAATSAVVTGIVFIVISDSVMTLICNRLGI